MSPTPNRLAPRHHSPLLLGMLHPSALGLLLFGGQTAGCNTSPRPVSAYMQELEGRVEALEARNSSLEQQISEIQQQLDQGAEPQEGTAPESWFIAEDMTIEVPTDDYPDIASALASLDPYTISSIATVTVSLIADLDLYEPVSVQHRDGARIVIDGGGNVTVRYWGTGSAISVSNGYSLGGIRRLYLEGPGLHGDDVTGTQGLTATTGGTMRCGDELEIGGFESGIYAEYGGIISCEGVLIHDCNYGMASTFGGIARVESSFVSEVESVGVRASYGGIVTADTLMVSDIGLGLRASYGGLMYAVRSSVLNAAAEGAFAQVQSLVVVADSDVSGSPAAEALGNSFLVASSTEFQEGSSGVGCAVATMDASIALDSGACLSGTMYPSTPGDGSLENAIYRP